jgi:hypothetical protein
MRFEFWTTPGQSHLKAILEQEDSIVGKREEGAGTEITLHEDTVTFDYEAKNIHPDILGLLCLVTFFPFVGNEVEFPKPVSSRLYEAFQNKCFTDKKDISFRNISNDVEIYKGEKIALSFGGGIDSSAVRKMFPEAFVIHEAHIKEGLLIDSHSHKVVEALQPNNGRLVKTNIRYLSKPGGWHSWPCSVSTSLIMATDMNFGLILTGSILGSCFVSNGVKFWDRVRARAWHGPSGNYWQSAFEAIGLTMFSPVTGISEMQTMNLSLSLLNEDQVVYCMEESGSACNKCSKCFRRDIIRTFIDAKHIPNWDEYNNEKIHTFLSKRPLYFGHIFSSATSLKPELFPNWVLEKIEGVPKVKTDWTMRAYTESFLLCPEEWRDYVSNRVSQYIDSMTDSDKLELQEWDQTKHHE